MATQYTGGVGMVKAPGLAGMGAPVNQGLLQKAWESEVAVEKVQYDPMLASGVKMSGSIPAMSGAAAVPKNKLVMDVTPKNKGVRSVTRAFAEALSGAGKFGTDSLLSNEETRQLKWATSYANDWKHGVALDSYGINYRELSPYGLKELTKGDLSKWQGELEGRYMREAIIEGKSSNCAFAPVSATRPLNPNFYFPGAATQPSTISDDTSIGGKNPYVLGGGGSMQEAVGTVAKAITPATCRLSINRIAEISKFARLTRYIEPIEIGGKIGYILWVHPDDLLYLKNTAVDDSVAKVAITAAVPADIAALLPGYSFFVDNVFVVEDPRAATMTVSGGSGGASYYLNSIGYLNMGKIDGRTTGITANTHFNLSLLTGNAPLMYLETEAPHYERQLDEYVQYDNLGYIGACGYTRTDWNFDADGVEANRLNAPSVFCDGAMVVATQRF